MCYNSSNGIVYTASPVWSTSSHHNPWAFTHASSDFPTLRKHTIALCFRFPTTFVRALRLLSGVGEHFLWISCRGYVRRALNLICQGWNAATCMQHEFRHCYWESFCSEWRHGCSLILHCFWCLSCCVLSRTQAPMQFLCLNWDSCFCTRSLVMWHCHLWI